MRTVLLVDDDEVCRAPAALLFRRMHWRVIEASDGEQGLSLALAERPDLILCDLLMPRGNGFFLCRAVRANPALAHIKVIICSGRNFLADRAAAHDAGADLYLLKPVYFSTLQETVEELVGSAAPQRDSSDETAPPSSADASTRIRFWGVRGSIPTPGPGTAFYGGNTSCVEVRADGQLLILDAGSGLRPLGVELAREFGTRPIHATLLLTHTHWDHIQGFPFFMPAYAARNHFRVLGFEGAREGLKATLAAQMQSPYFPVTFQQLSAAIAVEELNDLEFHVGDIPVRACFTNHPGVCVGYRLMTRAGSVVFMPDNETGHRHLHPAVGVEEGRLPSTLESSLVDFVRDAEVLIVDAQYTAAEYESHVGWGHGCLDAVVQMALSARVGRLVLFHHDPAHDDEFIAKMVADARQLVLDAGSSLLIEAAREGEEILLPAPVPSPVAQA